MTAHSCARVAPFCILSAETAKSGHPAPDCCKSGGTEANCSESLSQNRSRHASTGTTTVTTCAVQTASNVTAHSCARVALFCILSAAAAATAKSGHPAPDCHKSGGTEANHSESLSQNRSRFAFAGITTVTTCAVQPASSVTAHSCARVAPFCILSAAAAATAKGGQTVTNQGAQRPTALDRPAKIDRGSLSRESQLSQPVLFNQPTA